MFFRRKENKNEVEQEPCTNTQTPDFTMPEPKELIFMQAPAFRGFRRASLSAYQDLIRDSMSALRIKANPKYPVHRKELQELGISGDDRRVSKFLYDTKDKAILFKPSKRFSRGFDVYVGSYFVGTLNADGDGFNSECYEKLVSDQVEQVYVLLETFEETVVGRDDAGETASTVRDRNFAYLLLKFKEYK